MKKTYFLFLLFFSHSSFALTCPDGHFESNGVCIDACTVLTDETRSFTWDAYLWGDTPTEYCLGSHSGTAACQLVKDYVISTSTDDAGQYWTGDFKFTGNSCPYDNRGRFSGDTPNPFPYENDLNMNGIPDDEEDFDGDGIPNGIDPEPDVNNGDNADTNGNNIPDSLDPYVDELQSVEEKKFILTCSGVDCSALNSIASQTSKVASTNKDLARVIEQLAVNNLDKEDLRIITRGVGDAIKAASDKASLDTSNVRVMLSDEINTKNYEVKRRVIDSENNVIAAIERQGDSGGLTLLQDQTLHGINNAISAQDVEIAEIKTAVDNIEVSGGGLTSTQANQLKNAANRSNGAKKNTDTIKTQMNEALDVLNRNYRNSDKLDDLEDTVWDAVDSVQANTLAVSNKANSDLYSMVVGEMDAYFDDTQESISALSSQIEAISAASSTIEPSNTVASGGCNSGFSCSGNAYECFLAEQAFETACGIDSLAASSNGGTDAEKENAVSQLQAAMNDSGDQLIEDLKNYTATKGSLDGVTNEGVDVSSLLSEYDETNGLDFDEQCPAPHIADLGIAGIMEIDYTPFCDLALYVRAMLMLVASVGSMLMIAKFS